MPTTFNQAVNVTQTQTRTLSLVKAFLRTLSVTQTQTPSRTTPRSQVQSISVTQHQTPFNSETGGAEPNIDALAGIHTTASGNEAAPTYALKITDMRGTLVTDLILAEPDTVTWTLNQPDDFQFHFPKGAYSSTDLGVLAAGGGVTEAQVYRNGDLLTWGPITGLDASGSKGAVTCHGAGVDWYLNRRFIDAPIHNMLLNPDFEAGVSTDWTVVGTVTATTDTTNYQVGTQSAKLVATSPLFNGITQRVSTQPNGVGLLVTVSGWFFVEEFIGAPGDFSVGLLVEGSYLGQYAGSTYFPIDKSRPQKSWQKASATLWVPPNQSWQFDITLAALNGTIYWDDIKCVAMDSLATQGVGTDYFKPVDLSTIIQEIVGFEQNASFGKSHLNIGVSTQTIGVKQARAYQFVDHMQFDQAMREFIERADGCDYYVALTPTTRTFTTFAAKRGTDRTGSVTLKFVAGDATSNCVDYDFTEDAGACITHQTILGDDNGPDREEGDVTDASQVAGIVLEDVRQAPQDTKVGSLQPLAQERIDRYKNVPKTITMHVKGSSGLIPTLKCGDMVAINLDDAFVVVTGNFRIQAIELDCKTNILKVTVAKDTL